MTEIEKSHAAFANFELIKEKRANLVRNFLELGFLYRENKIEKYYKTLGYDSFYAFLGDAEAGFGKTAVNFFIRAYERYIMKLNIPQERLIGCGWGKLQIIEPVVSHIQDKDGVDEWLGKAESLSESDLITEVREAQGRPDRPQDARNRPVEAPGRGDNDIVAIGVAGYVALVKKSPCIVCGAGKSDAHHFPRTKGAGANDWHVIPLCRACHREAHDGGSAWLWSRRHAIFGWFYKVIEGMNDTGRDENTA